MVFTIFCSSFFLKYFGETCCRFCRIFPFVVSCRLGVWGLHQQGGSEAGVGICTYFQCLLHFGVNTADFSKIGKCSTTSNACYALIASMRKSPFLECGLTLPMLAILRPTVSRCSRIKRKPPCRSSSCKGVCYSLQIFFLAIFGFFCPIFRVQIICRIIQEVYSIAASAVSVL